MRIEWLYEARCEFEEQLAYYRSRGGEEAAAISNDSIYIDGEKVEAEVYKIDGNNYFKLRDLGKALDFYVGWTAERGVYIETAKPYAE